MGAPVPPQGNQKQSTERPVKIYGEQYLAGHPLPIGVVVFPNDPAALQPLQDGQARVALQGGWAVVHLTDYVITNRYTGAAVEVVGAEEFAERFGGGGPNAEG